MQINNVQLDQSPYLNLNQSLNKISSGKEINSAADDASSLSISDKLRTEASGLTQSIDNVNSGLASLQIADKSISEQSNILDTVKEKLLQASTDTTSQQGRDQILTEIKDLLQNFDNIASNTNYNEQTLLQNASEDKAASQSQQFQVGTSSEDIIETDSIQSNTVGVGLESLVNQEPSSFDASTARAYLGDVDEALTKLNDYRGDLGSVQNQLQSSGRNLFTQVTSTREAGSTIADLDYSKEISDFNKQNILAQIGAYGAAQSSNINQNIVTRLLT
ncbi:flagellin [Arcobacter sp. CECT 8989]|uniref:flagellin N-terminal helical domain-containing protein n=1 Tax=Arcobacter sp. CECT 8989 TaxID=2044509 RepID=UPI00100B53FD|nr:flagellin [Arcobacter sp. CECT 8989]RXK02615.1 flagellin [Arcobacter sp. CECT 8989]